MCKKIMFCQFQQTLQVLHNSFGIWGFLRNIFILEINMHRNNLNILRFWVKCWYVEQDYKNYQRIESHQLISFNSTELSSKSKAGTGQNSLYKPEGSLRFCISCQHHLFPLNSLFQFSLHGCTLDTPSSSAAHRSPHHPIPSPGEREAQLNSQPRRKKPSKSTGRSFRGILYSS